MTVPIRNRLQPLSAALAVAALLGGCDVGINGGLGNGDGSNNMTAAGDGLPCDVYKVLQTYCISCHGTTPTPGTPQSLASYADLMKASLVDSKQNYAARSLARMENAASPMPPKPASAVSAANLAIFKAWVNAGSPKGSCGGGDGGVVDPLNADPTCTSGSEWSPRSPENINMEPGGTCIACHVREGEGQRFQFAGTVFATGHEPDRCNGASGTATDVAQATVIIIDAMNVEHTMTVHSPSGNFGYGGVRGQTTAWPTPYTAKVVYMGAERVMATPQTDGDCNSCHTQDGTQDAPGRITLPIVP